jgi:hypothetical protein
MDKKNQCICVLHFSVVKRNVEVRGGSFNLSWVKFPAACCDKSELNPKKMILRGLPRRDFIIHPEQFKDTG